MFNLDKVHIILDEMVLNGCIVETNRARILAPLLILDKMTESWTMEGSARQRLIGNVNISGILLNICSPKESEGHKLQNGVIFKT